MNRSIFLYAALLFALPLLARADDGDALEKRVEKKTLSKKVAISGSAVRKNDNPDFSEPKLKRKSGKHKRK